jgi:hypothetical protein
MVLARYSRLNSVRAGANRLRWALEVFVVRVAEPVVLLEEALELGDNHLEYL